MVKPHVLILRAPGTNCHQETAEACRTAGGHPVVLPLQALLEHPGRLLQYHMLVIPGGFSYGDHLGAGRVLGLILRKRLGDHLDNFVSEGKPVMGICNGFQALMWAGLLPSPEYRGKATLTRNSHGLFECRWVSIVAVRTCPFTQGLEGMEIPMPVAHAEGRLIVHQATERDLHFKGLVAFRYTGPDSASMSYPWNPNGSWDNVAGLCNPQGNVLGIMPHPERACFPWHMPDRSPAKGLAIFRNAIRYALEAT
jgi:phosphoribosylformylglycinamidine synthase I